jgi:hypothetical protein
MINYEKAKILAQTWINLNNSTEVQIFDEETICKSYGWVFFHQSKSYIETQNFGEMLLGNSPILIDRFNGEIRILGTAYEAEYYLEEYEKTIPNERMQLEPECPKSN